MGKEQFSLPFHFSHQVHPCDIGRESLSSILNFLNGSNEYTSDVKESVSVVLRPNTFKMRSSSSGTTGIKRKASCLEDGESSISTNTNSLSSSRRAFIRASNRGTLKRAGPYLLGPRLGNSPVRSIVQCLAKKDGTDDFYSIKILTLADAGRESQDDKQGKMLLHTEYSLLSLLHDQDGVVHHHGLFKDEYYEEIPLEKDSSSTTTVHRSQQNSVARQYRIRHRLCLVLDCLCAHDFSSDTADLINLQHYVIREKRLSERETIIIFHDIVRVVECLHKVRLNK